MFRLKRTVKVTGSAATSDALATDAVERATLSTKGYMLLTGAVRNGVKERSLGLTNGSFELIVTPWESDLARSWRQASAQRQTLFRLGTVATNRVVGLL